MSRFYVCWTIDCESSRREIADTVLGESAVRGFADVLEQRGWRGTFFVVPEEVEPLEPALRDTAAAGHEIALHLHPGESHGPARTWAPTPATLRRASSAMGSTSSSDASASGPHRSVRDTAAPTTRPSPQWRPAASDSRVHPFREGG